MKNRQGQRENVIMAAIMSAVSCLVLLSASTAWFTGMLGTATVHAKEIATAEEKNIKVAVSAGGDDIASADGAAAQILIGLENLTNIREGEIAPGAFGQAYFYITPLSESVTGYEIIPQLALAQGNSADDMTPEELAAFMEMFGAHIVMFEDAACTRAITEDRPAQGTLSWNQAENKGIEKEIILYWKWYYEYPFTEEEENSLTEEAKQKKISEYDTGDTEIGNHINRIQFRFKFRAIH